MHTGAQPASRTGTHAPTHSFVTMMKDFTLTRAFKAEICLNRKKRKVNLPSKHSIESLGPRSAHIEGSHSD